MFLRQNTSQVIRFGPCLDATDGVTAETALTLTQADMQLSKDGGSFAQKSAAGNATHDQRGWYDTTLSTTDVNTVGELRLDVQQSANMLPVWDRWWVIEEVVYDAIYGAGAVGPLQSTVAGRTLDIAATGEAGVDFANIAGTLDAVNIGGNALTAAKIATDAIGASQFATNAVEKIADGVADEVLTGATHNIVNSLGRRIRELADLLIITSGTCQAAGQTPTNVRLESGESSTDDIHNFQRLALIGGTNAGFQVIISDYDGTNKDCTVTPLLPVACDATTEYEVTPAIVHAETQKGGYQGGQVWIDTGSGGAPGTQLYVNGVVDNPVNNIADARVIADALNMRVFHCLPGSSFALAQTFNNFEFTGAGYTLNLGTQDIGGCRFFFGSILGIGTGSSRVFFDRCIFLSAATLSSCNFITCNWSNTITLSSAGNYTCTDCFNGTNNGIAVLNFGTAVGNTNVNLNKFTGNIQIEAMGDTGTDTMFIDIDGVFTEGTCAGGAVDIHGIYDTVGITNLTLSETRPLTAAEVNTEVVAGAPTAAQNADTTLRRTYANARVSSDGDAVNGRSLLGAMGKLVNRVSIAGSTLTVFQEDDTTSSAPGFTQTVTTDAAADPITQVDTA